MSEEEYESDDLGDVDAPIEEPEPEEEKEEPKPKVLKKRKSSASTAAKKKAATAAKKKAATAAKKKAAPKKKKAAPKKKKAAAAKKQSEEEEDNSEVEDPDAEEETPKKKKKPAPKKRAADSEESPAKKSKTTTKKSSGIAKKAATAKKGIVKKKGGIAKKKGGIAKKSSGIAKKSTGLSGKKKGSTLGKKKVSTLGKKKKVVKAVGGKKVAKKRKDPNAPKRGKSAWVLYSMAMRPIVKKEKPELTFGGLTKEISARWKKVSAEDKKKYEDAAKEDKVRYEKEMEDYTPPPDSELPVKKTRKKAAPGGAKKSRKKKKKSADESDEESDYGGHSEDHAGEIDLNNVIPRQPRTKRVLAKSAIDKDIIFAASGCSPELMDQITTIYHKVRGNPKLKELSRFQDELDSKVTHLVVGSKKRTMKVLKALASGIWLTKTDWVMKALEKEEFTSPEDHEVTEWFKGAKASRIRTQKGGKGIFSTKSFYLGSSDYLGAPPREVMTEDLEYLIRSAGGTVAKKPDEADYIFSLVPMKEKETKATIVTFKFLFDSITEWKLLDASKYAEELRNVQAGGSSDEEESDEAGEFDPEKVEEESADDEVEEEAVDEADAGAKSKEEVDASDDEEE